jgi:voltage-gated potassium channel
MKQKIKKVIENPQTIQGKLLAFAIQFLIVISLITFSVETLPNLSEPTKKILRIIETITVIIFTFEYLCRIFVADNKLKFIFSFFGIVDLFAILPFYIASGIDLRAVRIFRLLRLFRILKLLRYSQAISRFHRAFLIAKEELLLLELGKPRPLGGGKNSFA